MKNIHEEIAQGQQSKAALAELESRFDIMHTNIHNQWEAIDPADKDGQHLLKLQLNALNQLRRSFKVDIDTGKLAEEQLKREQDNK